MTSWYVNPNVNLVFEPSGKLSMLCAADGAALVLLTLLFLETLTSEKSSEAEASDAWDPRAWDWDPQARGAGAL